MENKKDKPKYEIIKRYCALKGTNISRLERDLGFSKGSICKIDIHSPGMDRILSICDYLDMPQELLTGQAPPKEPAPMQQIVLEDDDDDTTTTTVVDSAMYPLLHKGDVLHVHHQRDTDPADYTVVQVGDTQTVRFVEYTDDGVWLKCKNASYGDKHYTVKDIMSMPIAVIGKAVSYERKL